eukprot:COSAG01_NODE_1513_length_10065_cov_63.160144_16_plen_66_part_00
MRGLRIGQVPPFVFFFLGEILQGPFLLMKSYRCRHGPERCRFPHGEAELQYWQQRQAQQVASKAE